VARDLHPSEGARYLLERELGPGDAATARYTATIYTPDAAFTEAAVLGDDGSVELAPTGAPAPEVLRARLVAMARLVARDAARLRSEGLPPWPQRILRWRR
jgi:hypothetical protein